MDNNPEYKIGEIANWLNGENTIEQYFAGTYSGEMPQNLNPRRAEYFGLAICMQGSLELKANLDVYSLKRGSLIVMPPEVIRFWKNKSNDYTEETLLFSKTLFPAEKTLLGFGFFSLDMPKVIQLNDSEMENIYSLLQNVKQTARLDSQRKVSLGKLYIEIVLNFVADYYDKYAKGSSKSNAALHIVKQFKKLLVENKLTIRTVSHFASLMNITPKYLSETLKLNTGKPAGDWIIESVVLEAKVKLEQTTLNVNQIADLLNFTDATSFGKYFKKYTGYSPGEYKNSR